MLVALQVIIEKTIEMDGQAFVVFIDYSKAFDIIRQVQMFQILSEMGFPKHIVALLEEYIGSLTSADGNKQRHHIPNWNGQENNARSCTDRKTQRNKQISENETSTLAGVDSSHLWC